MTLPPDALDALLGAMLAAQLALRDALHALGLTGEVAGQPAWPFAHRLAAEMLSIDGGHARRVALTLGCVLLAVALLPAALLVRARRVRGGLAIAALALVLLAPWPLPQLLLAPAVPTSLHRSPTGFAAEGIVRGQAVYMRLCARCHGADARGEGPDAARLPVWPPMLNGGLLWKRLDGELFWRIRHGMHGRGGERTMPGFGPVQISDAEIWQVLDYLQAHAAGRMLRESGAWERPVRVPDALVDCRHGGRRSLRGLTGQRLRIAVPDVPGPQRWPGEDPRFVTVLAHAMSGAAEAPECLAADGHLLPALALVLGLDADDGAAGYQLIVDRVGWLRARGQPGRAEWSEDDLVCRSAAEVPRAGGRPAADGLDALIRRVDSEPVLLVRGGFPH